MVDIQSTTAEIRRGIKEEEEEEDRRKKLQGKNIMVPLLHRAAINRLMFSENNITTKAYMIMRRWLEFLPIPFSGSIHSFTGIC